MDALVWIAVVPLVAIFSLALVGCFDQHRQALLMAIPVLMAIVLFAFK